MHRISNGTQVPALPTPRIVIGTPGYAAQVNPASGLSVTIIDPDCFNAMQDEICNVILAAGIALDKTSQSQLLAALVSFFSAQSKPNVAAFTTAGTYTVVVPAGVYWFLATVVGGGGGGANCITSTGTSGSQFGGGGGAGGLAIGIYGVTPGQSITVIVGAGGGPQSNGGSSSFGTFASCTGGNGSAFFSPAFTTCAGGQGGISVGATILGNSGGFGNDGQSGSIGTIAGAGAPGPFGGGGRAGSGGGASGQGPGAGGGGAYDTSGGGSLGSGTAFSGGNGHDGCVLLQYVQVSA